MRNPSAQVEKTIHGPAADVWNALTTPESLKKFFFGADVTTDWKVGQPIRFAGEFAGKPYEDKGKLLEIDTEKCLSFSHWSAMSGQADAPENYHVVTFDLLDQGQDTVVTLSQSNLMGGVTPSDVAHRAEYEKNWGTVLDGLAALFPGPLQ